LLLVAAGTAAAL